MANPTTNFGWVMPAATDLVTDLPADFDVFGQAVDTDFVDLKGGTTGQILSKTSATDLAFTWVAGSTAPPLTTKGDLYGFSTLDARIPIGTNNQVLTADSAQALGLKWATAAAPAGKSYSAISTTSLSGSTLTVTGLSGYDNFMFMIKDALVDNGQSPILMRINSDAGSSQYIYGGASFAQASSYAPSYVGHISSTTATSIPLGTTSSTTGSYFSAGMNLFGGNSTGGKAFESKFGLTAGARTDSYDNIISGVYKGSAVVSSISIISSTGNFSAGTIVIWGAA